MPDLTITGGTVTSTGAYSTQRDAEVDLVIENIGSAAALDYDLGFYATAPGDDFNNDNFLNFNDAPDLSGSSGPTAFNGLNVELQGLALGDWRIWAFIDDVAEVSEQDETNNVFDLGVLTVGDHLPDLTGEAPVLTGDSALQVVAGQAITFDKLLRNLGPADALGFSIEYRLSTNSIISTIDTFIGEAALDPLASGASRTESLDTDALALDLAPGTYWLGTLIDPDGEVAELDEFNNSNTVGDPIQIEVLAPPNLTVDSFGLHSSNADGMILEGAQVAVTYDVLNDGGADAGASRFQFYISTDDVIDAGDTAIGFANTPALAPGETHGFPNGINTTALPASITPGTYWVGGIADDLGAVTESDETDNASAPVQITVLADLPELTAYDLTATTPTTFYEGETIDLQVTGENSGSQPTGAAFEIEVYVSDDPEVTREDYSAGFFSLGPVGAGSGPVLSGNARFSNSSTLSPGTYYVAAFADPLDAVAERDETNNLSNVIEITILPQPGDLTLQPIIAYVNQNEFEGDARTTLNAAIPVHNIGPGAVAATNTAYFISADDTLDQNDFQLGNISTPRLTANNVRLDYVIDVELPPGGPEIVANQPFWFFAVADSLNAVNELDETNNVRGIEVVVPGAPDFEITGLEISSNHVAPDGRISIQFEVSNVGTATSEQDSVSILLSENDIISGADTALSSFSLSPIAPGESQSFVFHNLRMPSEVTDGLWHIGVIADPDSSVAEPDEANNFSDLTAAGTELIQIAAPTPAQGDQTIAATGHILLSDAPLTLQFGAEFVNPVVFAKVETAHEDEAVTVRLSDITDTGFTLQLQEPTGYDGAHAFEKVSWMVVEAGDWVLPDGTHLSAGMLDTDRLLNAGAANLGFETVSFEDAEFDAAPVVQTQVQTSNDTDWVIARQTDATVDGFGIGLQEDEATDGSHGIETLGWLAMDAGSGTWDGRSYQAGTTTIDVAETFVTQSFDAPFGAAPSVLTSLSSFNGRDPAYARVRSVEANLLEVRSEEEQSADTEVGHVGEDVDYLLFEGNEGTLSGSRALPTFAETGTLTLRDATQQTVTLQRSYDNPVAIAFVATENGRDPVNVRISAVSGNDLTLQLQEPSNLNPSHGNERVNFLVMEAGTWILPDGTLVEAGTLESDRLSTAGFEDVTFDAAFDSTPVVLSHVQTLNGRDFVTTRQRATNADGFKLTMQEEDAKNGSGHASEKIGWIALEAGSGFAGDVSWLAGSASGVTDANSTVGLDAGLSNVVAGLSSYNGGDSAWVRGAGGTNTSFDVSVEEDTTADAETDHNAENVDYFAFDQVGVMAAYDYDFFT